MPLFDSKEHNFAEAIAGLTQCNPFLPERIRCEQLALGEDFVDLGTVWHRTESFRLPNPNVQELGRRAARITQRVGDRLRQGRQGTLHERQLYYEVATYFLYDKYQLDFFHFLSTASGLSRPVSFWPKFRDEVARLFNELPLELPGRLETDHLFACFFQVRRAFHYCFHYILGGSMPAARLRATVWQSIFTHDLHRYRRSLFPRMGEISTLITGPSGTGKELVARAIGLARYLPFNANTGCFPADPEDSFFPLNLSALAPAVIESELFGHRRGAFTGAEQDRTGWLEACGALGTVFLDEIGEVDPAIQVKLLRVLQSRSFERLGETRSRPFAGKIIAATNRDMEELIQRGSFRADLYYRLCADVIETPSLAAQLAESDDDLQQLITLLAKRLVDEQEAEGLAEETVEWIFHGRDDNGRLAIGPDYRWPGNVRELEQCVRNVLIRRRYLPPNTSQLADDGLDAALVGAELSAEELVGRYCTLIYAKNGSYSETARRLGIDRRTVKAKINPERLAGLKPGPGSFPEQ